MSMDEAGSESTFGGKDSILDQLDTPAKTPRKKIVADGPRKQTTEKTLRTHKHDSVYKQDLTKYLDKLAVDGYTVVAITVGIDIRGFEVASYKDEVRS